MTVRKNRTPQAELGRVTPLWLLLGKRADVYQAHLARLTFTGFKLAKMGGWI